MINNNLQMFVSAHADLKIDYDPAIYTIITDVDNTLIDDKKYKVLRNDSGKSEVYGEFRDMYYVWKNKLATAEYIGFVQYRRCFSFINDIPDLNELFKSYDAVLMQKTDCVLSPYNCYCSYHPKKYIQKIENIIHSDFPEYIDAFNHAMHDTHFIYFHSMFIIKNKDFYQMFDFLFKIMDKFIEEFSISSFESLLDNDYYMSKIPAITLEYIINVYYDKQFKNVYEQSLHIIEFQKKPVLLVAIVKQENLYIREWVEYYKNLGVSNILLYDNNDIDGEQLTDVIGDYIDSEFVIVNNYRGKPNAQIQAYHNAFFKYITKYEWFMFFDADEFLHLTLDKNIVDYLNRPIFDGYDEIKLNWVMYGDDNKLHYENKPVLQRLDKDTNITEYSTHTKVILRYETWFHWTDNTHYPYSKTPFKACNSLGVQCKAYTVDIPFNGSLAYLKHFPTKTIEEYIRQKCTRKDAVYKDDVYNKYNIDSFFNYNGIERTPEKEELAKKLFEELGL